MKRTYNTRLIKKKNVQEERETQYQSESNSELQLESEDTHSVWSIDMLSTESRPKKLLGRVMEKQSIHKFIKGCIVGEINNRVLYISGVPGVGKTATTKQIITNLSKEISSQKVQFYNINAMTIKKPKDIYKSILLSVKPKIQSRSSKPEALALQLDKFLQTTKKKHFFLVDQIDFLYTNDESVLYNLFEWSYNVKGGLALIVIANTMDFPERLSPKLMSRMGNHRLVFKPYTYSQVKQIVQDRLIGSNLFQPKALQYAAKKLSAFTSDIRKIFNVLRQAVIQKCQDKKIQVRNIERIWEEFAIQTNQIWRNDLPPMYLSIIQIVKKQGGKSHSGKIYEDIKAKKTGISCIQVEIILQELHDMGILKVNAKNLNGYAGYNVILLKI